MNDSSFELGARRSSASDSECQINSSRRAVCVCSADNDHRDPPSFRINKNLNLDLRKERKREWVVR